MFQISYQIIKSTVHLYLHRPPAPLSSPYLVAHFWEPKRNQCSCWRRSSCSMSGYLLALCCVYT